jgi:hypothetical protein
LERLLNDIRAIGGAWFARGREIAAYVRGNPSARREIDFDFTASSSVSVAV